MRFATHRSMPATHARTYHRREPEHSALYQTLQIHLEGFLAETRSHGGLPAFVERELKAFLRCGILAHGFARAHCDQCGFDRLVAFSCKGRGFCPSCAGKRMTRQAEHLIDQVIPPVQVRQWVLTMPHRPATSWPTIIASRNAYSAVSGVR